MTKARLANLLMDQLEPIGRSATWRVLGDTEGEGERGTFVARAKGRTLVVRRGDARPILPRDIGALERQLHDRLGIELPRSIRETLSAELWRPEEGPVTRHEATPRGMIFDNAKRLIELDVSGLGKGDDARLEIASLLEDRLPPFGSSTSERELGRAPDGSLYRAYAGRNGSLLIGKERDPNHFQSNYHLTASEAPVIAHRLREMVGIDLSADAIESLSAMLWSREGAVTRHAASSAEAPPSERGTNIILQLKGMNGRQLADLLSRRLEPVGDSAYYRQLGSSADGAIYSAYAGVDRALVVVKGSTDKRGGLEELRPISASELPAVIAALEAIGIDVSSDLRATLEKGLAHSS
jgi:hypothetical protein